ncbi:MAG: beta-lactamase family protein [Ignavibacteriales bacterium]|nr:beta-lactamase family protein [Ignavibacteriales bacterium]
MKYKFISSLLIFTLLFFSVKSNCFAQMKQDINSSKIVEKYVEAFNSGEESMKKYFLENISSKSLKARPIETRLAVYKQLKSDMGSIELKKIEIVSESMVSAVVYTQKKEWFQFLFELDTEMSNKILSIRIEDTDEPQSSSSAKLSETEALQSIIKYLDEETSKDQFSGVALIAKNGKPIFKRAYGEANKEFNVRNRPDTKFNLGSINKIFTQIAVGQLYEHGRLSFNDPIVKYIPEYPNKTAAEKVTIRHLLDMSSGIGDFFGEKFDSTPKDRFRTLGDFLSMFANDSLTFEPGTQRQYSNGGYIVLGLIIEKVSGQSYYDYVKEHIFKIAGMPNTDSYETDIPIPNLAEGYTRDSLNRLWRKNIYTRPALGSSAGGGYSTVEDLLSFVSALEKGILFKEKDTWNILKGEPVNKDDKKQGGMGIFGGAPGINSGIETDIGKGYSAIVMSNYDPPTAMKAMKKIRSFLSAVH